MLVTLKFRGSVWTARIERGFYNLLQKPIKFRDTISPSSEGNTGTIRSNSSLCCWGGCNLPPIVDNLVYRLQRKWLCLLQWEVRKNIVSKVLWFIRHQDAMCLLEQSTWYYCYFLYVLTLYYWTDWVLLRSKDNSGETGDTRVCSTAEFKEAFQCKPIFSALIFLLLLSCNLKLLEVWFWKYSFQTLIDLQFHLHLWVVGWVIWLGEKTSNNNKK